MPGLQHPRLSVLGTLYFLCSISRYLCTLKTHSSLHNIGGWWCLALSLQINFFSSSGYVVLLACGWWVMFPSLMGTVGTHVCPFSQRVHSDLVLSDPGRDCPTLHFLGPVPLRFVPHQIALSLSFFSGFTQLQKVASIKFTCLLCWYAL